MSTDNSTDTGSGGASRDPLARIAENQTWITDSIQTAAQDAITNAVNTLGGDALIRALHGD